MVPRGAPGDLFWRLLASKGVDANWPLRSWRPLRSNFGFSVPPGSPGTSPGTPPGTILGHILPCQLDFRRENVTEMNPECLANSRKTPPRKQKRKSTKVFERRPQTNQMPLSFLFYFCSFRVFRSFGFRVSGLGFAITVLGLVGAREAYRIFTPTVCVIDRVVCVP